MPDEMKVVVGERVERQLSDRRRGALGGLAYGAIVHGRRRGSRRQDDARAYYVDWYDERLFIATIGIFLLCCLDAFFTLILIGRGAEEINPFMAKLLEHGVSAFLYTKLTITGFGLVFLVVHATFCVAGTVRVSHLLYAILGSYVTLFVYQLDMLARTF